MAAGMGKSSMFVERMRSEHTLGGAAGEPSEDGRDPGAPPPPPPTRMAPAPPPHTCQIGQSLERHLLVLVQEHLDLPQADPQVRLVEFVWDVPTCARRRGVRGCRAGRSVVALGGGTGGEFSAGSDQGPCSPVLSSTGPTVSFTANNGRHSARGRFRSKSNALWAPRLAGKVSPPWGSRDENYSPWRDTRECTELQK